MPCATLLPLSLALVAASAGCAEQSYAPSTVISSVAFDSTTRRVLHNGADNWVITWADDDNQYTSWGDGGGFGGTNQDRRVGLGFGRIEGDKDDYRGFNVWGGKDPENPAEFVGKSYGLISIDGVLYAWVSGVVEDGSTGSGSKAYLNQRLYESTDHAAHWRFTGVEFTQSDFSESKGFYVPTILNFGRDYAGARDDYVYSYAPELKDETVWNVQFPGEIALIRVPKARITEKSAYEYFAGLTDSGEPAWTREIGSRKPVFRDEQNGVMRTAVSYNPALERYLLITQQISRHRDATVPEEDDGYVGNGHIGIYDAPEPWGPWTTVLFANAWTVGLQLADEPKSTFWNLSNKWLSDDGTRFVLIYSDSHDGGWVSIEGTFERADSDKGPERASSHGLTPPESRAARRSSRSPEA